MTDTERYVSESDYYESDRERDYYQTSTAFIDELDRYPMTADEYYTVLHSGGQPC